MNARPKIILVDDHDIFREGLKMLIEQTKVGEVIAEASDGSEFLDIIKENNPDLVLMDISMPEMNGIEATQTALKNNPKLKILVLSMFGDEEYYYKMVQAGAKGFVLKNAGKRELETAIKEVVAGGSYFSNELLRKIIAELSSPQIRPKRNNHSNSQTQEEVFITRREMEVLKLICEGLSTTEIADNLHLSPKTIESHRSKLISKTNSKNSASLVMYAIKNQLVAV